MVYRCVKHLKSKACDFLDQKKGHSKDGLSLKNNAH